MWHLAESIDIFRGHVSHDSDIVHPAQNSGKKGGGEMESREEEEC